MKSDLNKCEHGGILWTEETEPAVILDLICGALKGTQSTPRTLSTLFIRTGLSLAIQNKLEESTWSELKLSILDEVAASLERLVQQFEAGRAGA